MDDDTLRELRRQLTERQARFAEEYVRNGGNATEAARVAGYSARSENHLAVQASENLKKPKIRAYIEALTERARPTVRRDIEAIIDRLTAIALGDEIVTIMTKKGPMQVAAYPRDQVEAAKTLLKVAGRLDPKVRVELETSLVGQLARLRQLMPAEAYRALLAALRQLGGVSES